MCNVTITRAPALDHDAMMAQRFASKVSANGHLERAIVWNLCAHLAAAGFAVVAVDDGEEVTKTADAKAALELVFNLDEAWLYFRKGRNGRRRVVFLVLGEGDTIITDWSYTEGDADGFNAAMNAFNAEAVAPALFTATGEG